MIGAWRYLTDCFGVKHWKFYNVVGRPEAPGTNMIGPCVKPAGGFSFKALALPAIASLPLVLPPGDEYGAPAFVNLPATFPIAGGYGNFNEQPISFGPIGNLAGFNGGAIPIRNAVTIPVVLSDNSKIELHNTDIMPPTNPPVYYPPITEVPPIVAPGNPPVAPPPEKVNTPEPSGLSVIFLSLAMIVVLKFRKNNVSA